MFWSLALGADFRRCIREVGDLFDRSFHSHANRFAITLKAESESIFPACDRGIRLAASTKDLEEKSSGSPRFAACAITAPDLWETVLSALDSRS
jgi:glutamate formiminotransferase